MNKLAMVMEMYKTPMFKIMDIGVGILAGIILIAGLFFKVDIHETKKIVQTACILPPSFFDTKEIVKIQIKEKIIRVPVSKSFYKSNVLISTNSPSKTAKYFPENYLTSLTSSYQQKLHLNEFEMRQLLSAIHRQQSSPCGSWRLPSKFVQKCTAQSQLEAGHYAINAKLIPCYKKVGNDPETLLACYLRT